MNKVSVQNQKGLIVPLIIFTILALGLAGGLYLVKNPNLNIFKSRASSSPIEVKAADGSSFPKEGDVFVVDPAKVSPLSVKLELTSPLGPPAPTQTPSTPAPKPVATQTPVPAQTPWPTYEDQNVNEGGN